MQIESFAVSPLQNILPSYVYWQYSDDDDLQAFAASFNVLSQGYLTWFNQNPLGVYTSPYINGALLDWVGNGIYGISRPVLASSTMLRLAGYADNPYATISYGELLYSESDTSSIATDDIYKRVMTWHLYRGDGQQFCLQWLKNRINRFINGINGMDWPVLNSPPSITVSGTVFTVTAFDSPSYSALQLCYANNILAFPFLYSIEFINNSFYNNGGVLTLPLALSYPTSPSGLPDGSVWWNGGLICVVPGVTPDPSAPPVYFAGLIPGALLASGGGNLPLSNPGVGSGQIWNNGGVISIA